MTSRLATFARVGLALMVVGSLAGCDTVSNLFSEKEVPLQGERHPVPRVAPPPPDTVPQPLSSLPAPTSAHLA